MRFNLCTAELAGLAAANFPSFEFFVTVFLKGRSGLSGITRLNSGLKTGPSRQLRLLNLNLASILTSEVAEAADLRT